MSAAYISTAPNTATGSVTSVSGSGGTTGLTLAGGPITTTGTLTIGGVLIGANGGTGVANTGKTITVGGNFSTDGALALTTGGSATSFLNAAGVYATPAGLGNVTEASNAAAINRVMVSGGADKSVKDGVGSGPTTAGLLDAGTITGTTSLPFVIRQTWNNAALSAPIGLQFDVVNTASTGTGVPFLWTVNGSQVAQITLTGRMFTSAGSAALPNFATSGTTTTGFWSDTTSAGLTVANNAILTTTSSAITFAQPWTLAKNQNAGTSGVISNTTSGTGAFAALSLTNGTTSNDSYCLSAGYTTSGALVAGAGVQLANGSGGISMAANHASGLIRFYTGGSAAGNERMRVHASGGVSIGNTTDPGATILSVTGGVLSDGDVKTTTIGKTFSVKSGSNAKAGTFTLTAGAVTVSNTGVTANSVIIPTLKTASGARTFLDIVPTAATGFVVTGAATDGGTYNYVILEVN